MKKINTIIYTIEEIKEIVSPIFKKYNIYNVYLFGSYARNEANKESDIEEFGAVKQELLSSSASNLSTIVEKIQDITDSVDNFKENTAVNLSNYLTVIKDLFNEFSSKININENNSEILEKLSNLEILMSRMDVEKNDNFSQLHSILIKNSETLNDLGNIKGIIEEHSRTKDEKLDNIENLISKFDSENNQNLAQIQSLLEKNGETIDGLSDLKSFIEAKSDDKTEKLNVISEQMAKFDTEKNINFSQLKDMLNENTKALESLNVRTGTDYGWDRLELLLRENNENKEEKFDTLKSLVNEYRDSVAKLAENIQSRSEKEVSEITELKSIVNEVLPRQSALNELSEQINKKVLEYKDAVSEEISSVKDTISSIIGSINSAELKKQDDNNITLKLSELNNQITESAQSYEHALSLISSRMDEYVESAENISLATNAKFDDTAKEFEGIHESFESLS